RFSPQLRGDRCSPDLSRAACAERTRCMPLNLEQWPSWLMNLLKTIVTIGGAYLVGRIINRVVINRLVRLASRSRGHWADIIGEEVKRRVVWWVVLAGAWLSISYWQLNPSWRTFDGSIIIALVGISATLAASSIATRLVAEYGPRLSPNVPAAGLTQNLTRLIVLVIGALVILNGLGVAISPILTAVGIGGLAGARALHEPLSDLLPRGFPCLS